MEGEMAGPEKLAGYKGKPGTLSGNRCANARCAVKRAGCAAGRTVLKRPISSKKVARETDHPMRTASQPFYELEINRRIEVACRFSVIDIPTRKFHILFNINKG
jgi:hypothetical protein